jgi:hypothetical protein
MRLVLIEDLPMYVMINKHKYRGMKKLFLVITLLFVTNSYSQTKQESEKWILDKLKLYSKNFTTNNYFSYKKPTFKLDGNNLIINYKYSEGVFTINGLKKTTIPIWAIKDIRMIEYEDSYGYKVYNFKFNLEKYCKECSINERWEETGYKRVEYESVNKYGRKVIKTKRLANRIYTKKYRNQKEVTSVDVRFVSKDPEENFVARFNKAIKHLQTLYPKQVKKKETF